MATWYTATTGNDTTGDGSQGNPYATLNKAHTVAADGDTINMLAGTYNVTTTTTISKRLRIAGYTAAPGDGGKATIDGGTSGVSYQILNLTGAFSFVSDLIVQNNGASGNAVGINITSVVLLSRVVVHAVRGSGLQCSNIPIISECEFYGTNQAGGGAVVNSVGQPILRRCIVHDPAGSGVIGFYFTSAPTEVSGCIADTCTSHGFMVDTGVAYSFAMKGCEAYNNTGDGLRLNQTGGIVAIESSNFVKNGGYGINLTGTSIAGYVQNCGFGSGTQANTSGNTNGLTALEVSGTATYASGVTPWTDPANGDFRISLAAAQGTGRGSFTQTAASYAGTVGYPDIGAAQHADPSTYTEQDVADAVWAYANRTLTA